MDLSRYKNIILYVGGYEEAKTITQTFKKKYKSLLQSLSGDHCNIYMSGLLSRGGIDIKPYNEILKDLSSQFKAKFIDNHDSFIMVSGELPLEYFQADRINLRFPGTFRLVRNINNNCTILLLRPGKNDVNPTGS